MKKLVNISMIASPHMVRFVPYLRKYFDADFYFYDQLGGRQSWWKVDLGEYAHILPCKFKWRGRYLTLSVLKVLREKNPDVVMLGTFSVPSNYLAYCWARWHGKKTVVFTERSRNLATGKLHGFNLFWRVIRFLYRNVDRVFVVSRNAVPQYRDTFKFGEKAVFCPYPCDLDRYFLHPTREGKKSFTILFANRMTDIYNPIGAVEIFAKVLKRHPETRMKINATGELRKLVEARIVELGIDRQIEFLDHITCWEDLSEVYASSDIMLLPAKYSNGNYTVRECLASGMACVVSENNQGQLVQTYLKDSGTGCVLPLDIDLFVEKICWYIEHPEEFARIAPINRAEMKSMAMAGTAELYNSLLSKIV